MPHIEQLLYSLLCYVLFPVWLLAGVGDYLCHRRSDIGCTSGFRESLLHLLEAIQIGVPLLAVLLLEINSLVILVTICAVVAHTATAQWDSSYADLRRRVTPLEQHMHSYLEIIPMVAASLLVLLHWNTFLDIFGAGSGEAIYALRVKRDGANPGEIACMIGLTLALQALPLLEECWRTWRQRDMRTVVAPGRSSVERYGMSSLEREPPAV